MSIRYAPDTLEKLAQYERALEARTLAGALTKAEAAILYTARRDAMFRALDEPKRSVKATCPECGKATATIGAQTFRCPCSPSVERSVWDHRT